MLNKFIKHHIRQNSGHLYLTTIYQRIKKGDQVFLHNGTIIEAGHDTSVNDLASFGYKNGSIIATNDPAFQGKLPGLPTDELKRYCEELDLDTVLIEFERVYEDQLEGDSFVPRVAGWRPKVGLDNVVSLRYFHDTYSPFGVKQQHPPQI